jgi:hypothetical protein
MLPAASSYHLPSLPLIVILLERCNMLVAPGDCFILRHAHKLLGKNLMGRDMERRGMIKGYIYEPG